MHETPGSQAGSLAGHPTDPMHANPSVEVRPNTREADVRIVLPKRDAIQNSFSAAYQAQLPWSQTSVRSRARILARFASLLVDRRKELAATITVPSRSGYQETLTAELLPLADAARWVGQSAPEVLAPRYLGSSGRPLWLGRLKAAVHRVPHGLVLIIGTWNYSIFLTGVQILQALAAGNAVAIKPAPGCEATTRMLVEILLDCGVPDHLMVILDSSIEAGKLAIDIGVDHIVMTGSSQSGRTVLSQAIPSLTSATMELSGSDAVYVLPGADLHRVCDLLRFGLRLNGGATCISPRRVFVPEKISEVFHRLIAERLAEPEQQQWRTYVAPSTHKKLWDGVQEALEHGASLIAGDRMSHSTQPKNTQHPSGWMSSGLVVLTDVRAGMKLYSQDIFAPLLMIVPVESWSDALKTDSQCPYALAASIFGPYEDALRLVPFISAGTITINDMIVPTADPRLPFGGRGESGFGVTRGSEGLLSMTTIKVVSTRLGAWLPHTKLPQPGDEQLLDGLLQFLHGRGWKKKLGGLRQIVQAVLSQRKRSKKND
ncbi:MAG: aldehyde dehydrogenase family protein [Planctomycetota bacterium]